MMRDIKIQAAAGGEIHIKPTRPATDSLRPGDCATRWQWAGPRQLPEVSAGKFAVAWFFVFCMALQS